MLFPRNSVKPELPVRANGYHQGQTCESRHCELTERTIVLISFTLLAMPRVASLSDGYRDDYDERWCSVAYWLVTVLCVVPATYIGHITRPR